MSTSSVNWANVVNGVVQNSNSTSKSGGVDSLATRDTFLKLLMAQVRNQNPLNPTDGVQFLSELAQFSGLEQNLQTNTTLTSIKNDLDQIVKGSQSSSSQG